MSIRFTKQLERRALGLVVGITIAFICLLKICLSNYFNYFFSIYYFLHCEQIFFLNALCTFKTKKKTIKEIKATLLIQAVALTRRSFSFRLEEAPSCFKTYCIRHLRTCSECHVDFRTYESKVLVVGMTRMEGNPVATEGRTEN